jgi:hypothetical protein
MKTEFSDKNFIVTCQSDAEIESLHELNNLISYMDGSFQFGDYRGVKVYHDEKAEELSFYFKLEHANSVKTA